MFVVKSIFVFPSNASNHHNFPFQFAGVHTTVGIGFYNNPPQAVPSSPAHNLTSDLKTGHTSSQPGRVPDTRAVLEPACPPSNKSSALH